MAKFNVKGTISGQEILSRIKSHKAASIHDFIKMDKARNEKILAQEKIRMQSLELRQQAELINDLRRKYTWATGKKPDLRWGVEKLQNEINQA